MSQAPPSASITVTQRMDLVVPGIGMRTSVTLLRTHSSSRDSVGIQNASKAVGS